MSEQRFKAAPTLERLKDFQRRTVDYVFDRLFGESSTSRFLIADEVGLGKTLVAKGIIARTLEHLQDEVERVDVVYVCSNSAIATQNVSRLNVSGERGFALASRLTFLPTQVQHLSKNKFNFISFTPGTTFDLKSRGGRVEERALLYRMLKDSDWNPGRGLFNMLQGTTRKRENWRWWAHKWETSIDEDLAQAFREGVATDDALVERLQDCCERFQPHRKKIPWADSNFRYALLGELRLKLAKTCLHALQPNLVILDEFQRFKDLLDGDDEGAQLARDLFSCPGSRTLLLSATPYKMLSLNHEQEDDHYPDFLRTLGFLFEDENAVDTIRIDIQNYRKQLYALADGRGEHGIEEARNQLQRTLLQVMCRNERVAISEQLDAMLIEPPRPALLEADDLDHAMIADQAAQAVGARAPLEYWKSSPYLLNFLKHYDLRRRIDDVAEAPPEALLSVFQLASAHLLTKSKFDEYEEIAAANARMRVLFSDTLEKGLWRLLWMPPSLPYSAPSGAYAEVKGVTKSLVFSAWNVVPDAIAALATYEAERRMLGGFDRTIKHDDLYDRLKPLLRFSRGKMDRLTGMPVVAWMLPSVILAEAIDPLQLALDAATQGQVLSQVQLLEGAEEVCRKLLEDLPPGVPGQRPDERWYWAAPILLEKSSKLRDWLVSREGWLKQEEEHDLGERFREHVRHLAETAEGTLVLGPRPDDLPRLLAEFALAAPGVCALRALRRIAPGLSLDDPDLLSDAAHISNGFRTLFNLPETIALLRGDGEEAYWRLTLQYALDGNIQALLDEQVHVLVEQLGLVDSKEHTRTQGVAQAVADALSIRTAQIKVDELTPQETAIEQSSFNLRCRFALRFGDLRNDNDKTLARADTVRTAFNSPFRPFILASTSIGQEGLDFHTWCHAIVHWNLPSNPVDLEQREGRIHRYKGHAVRKNIAENYGLPGLVNWNRKGDPWKHLFTRAKEERPEGSSDLVPFWVYEQGSARIERRVPLIPFSREVGQLERLKRGLALYRLVFGQPRQEDLLAHLADRYEEDEARQITAQWRICLAPPRKAQRVGEKRK